MTYTVFNYLSLFPALVQYIRFGILPFIRWLFSDECRVFSAGTRKSTFVERGCFGRRQTLTLGGLHSFRVPSFIQGWPQHYVASPWT